MEDLRYKKADHMTAPASGANINKFVRSRGSLGLEPQVNDVLEPKATPEPPGGRQV